MVGKQAVELGAGEGGALRIAQGWNHIIIHLLKLKSLLLFGS